MIVYPIKFNPILKEKIWGGAKLHTVLGKGENKDNIGESWEISDVQGNVSVVNNGLYSGQNLKALIEAHQDNFLGKKNFQNYGNNFPLLIKFLDAETDLSVQVHPDNDMAKKHHNALGKTEMWYIMDSDKNADIVLGLKDRATSPEVLNHITSKNVNTIFNREKVTKGDSFFIPAGKIHAIGGGVLAAEIQQTSDITYRVYDWGREDDNGKKRELHTKLAEQATKTFELNAKADYNLESNGSSNLAHCEYFTTNILDISKPKKKDYKKLDSFVILMCVEGNLDVTANKHTESLKTGETLILPAAAKDVMLNSKNAKILEVFID